MNCYKQNCIYYKIIKGNEICSAKRTFNHIIENDVTANCVYVSPEISDINSKPKIKVGVSSQPNRNNQRNNKTK